MERRFLDYARRQARKEEDGRLLFSDIVPIAATEPYVAANAFYRESMACPSTDSEADGMRTELLVLASKSVVIVEGQEEPYGEVCVRATACTCLLTCFSVPEQIMLSMR